MLPYHHQVLLILTKGVWIQSISESCSKTFNQWSETASTINLQQLDPNALIAALDECEVKNDEIKSGKRQKVVVSSSLLDSSSFVTPIKVTSSTVSSPPVCTHCRQRQCHNKVLGGYCVSKVFEYCDNKDNILDLDWDYCGKSIYEDAYKEIWRTITYLNTDVYDPSTEVLSIPQCMVCESMAEAKKVIECKNYLKRVEMFYRTGAMVQYRDQKRIVDGEE